MTNKYLEALERFEIAPNFWCSDEYFNRAGWGVTSCFDQIWVVNDEEELMLPMIDLLKGQMVHLYQSAVWADFEGFEGQTQKTFLDYEFIYDPKHFLDLSGGKWQIFRKNSRKFINRHPGKVFQYMDIKQTKLSIDLLTDLLICWLEERRENEVIHDDEVALSYIQEGINRKVLFDQDGKVYGVNIYDENYKYVNYRYCFCLRGEFLSEYMRLLFYTDIDILDKNKLVNDGGALDNPELKRFKEKLNPVKIREVYSYEKGG